MSPVLASGVSASATTTPSSVPAPATASVWSSGPRSEARNARREVRREQPGGEAADASEHSVVGAAEELGSAERQRHRAERPEQHQPASSHGERRTAGHACARGRPADPPAEPFPGQHQPQQREHQRRDLPVLEEPHRQLDLLSDAPGADEAQHRRRADGALQRVEDVAHQPGERLRQEREEDDGLAAPPRRREYLARRWIHVLQDVRHHPPQHPGVRDPQRERARPRPEPHRDDEQQRPEQLGHGAEHPEHSAREQVQHEAEPGARTVTGGERTGAEQRRSGEDAQRHCEHDRHRRSRDPDRQRASHRRRHHAQERRREIRRNEPAHETPEPLERLRREQRSRATPAPPPRSRRGMPSAARAAPTGKRGGLSPPAPGTHRAQANASASSLPWGSGRPAAAAG